MTCNKCNDCNSNCESTNCCGAKLTYGGVGTEIAGDMTAAISTNVNVQNAILNLIGDLSGLRTCEDTKNCLIGSPELSAAIQAEMGALDCADVANCLSQTASINALAALIAGSNDFKNAIVNLIGDTVDAFTCDDVADCIENNATVRTELTDWLSTKIKKVGPITRTSGTTLNVADAAATGTSILLSWGVTSGTQAGNRTWNTTSGNILFTSTVAETSLQFYYVMHV